MVTNTKIYGELRQYHISINTLIFYAIDIPYHTIVYHQYYAIRFCTILFHSILVYHTLSFTINTIIYTNSRQFYTIPSYIILSYTILFLYNKYYPSAVSMNLARYFLSFWPEDVSCALIQI